MSIIIVIILILLNTFFRYIKMSSPHLNNLIIVGCILTYSSVIFLGLDSQLSSVTAFPYICTARAWLLMAGFSLAFGSMFSKTWRVHSIFTDVKLNKKVITDYQLFMVVGVLLFMDLIIMTTWQVADPFYRETKEMDAYVRDNILFFFKFLININNYILFFYFKFILKYCLLFFFKKLFSHIQLMKTL